MQSIAGLCSLPFTWLVVAMVVAYPRPAEAEYIDLTTLDAMGDANGALFFQNVPLSGTGRFPAFVQIEGQPDFEAYNTTVNDVLNNGSSDTFNHEISISELPIHTVGGIDYYSFYLDINESNGMGQSVEADKFLSLDEIQIYTSNVANQSTGDPSTLGTLVWDLDGLGDSTVLLDFNLGTGSGRADMELLVPVSLFSGGPFVYLYSQFGGVGTVAANELFDGSKAGNYGASDGFEEWALGLDNQNGEDPPDPLPAVPEPATILLLGSGLAAAAAARRRQNRA